MKKKLIVLLSLVLVMYTLLCACGSDETEKTNTPKEEVEQEGTLTDNNQQDNSDSKLKSFYEKATEIKVGQTYTLKDGTIISLNKVEEYFEEGFDWPMIRLHILVNSTGNKGGLYWKGEMIIKGGEELSKQWTDIWPNVQGVPEYEELIEPEEDGSYILGEDLSGRQKILESDLSYYILSINDSILYFDIKSLVTE